MDSILMYITIIAAAAMVGWWGAIVFSAYVGQKRKIAKRLSNAVSQSGPNLAQLSVVLKEDMAEVPAFLARKAYIQVISRKLSHAFPNATLTRFLTISALCGVVPCVTVSLVSGNPAGTCAAFAIGAYIPLLLLDMRYKKRLKMMTTQLPEALDFLSRVMRAGHSMSTGLQMMAEELPKPLSEEFRRVYDQHSLGQPLETCLKEMSGRVESTDFAFFVTAVLIQRQTGGDLSEVLGNISTLVRSRMRLSRSVGAKTAEGRLTGMILVLFPIIMFGLCYYLNPQLYGDFLKDPTGKMLLGGAGTMIIMGMFAIKKITTVKV